MRKWYTIHVEQGKELLVKLYLEKFANINDFQILLPRYIRFEWKNGEKYCVEKLIFKNYIFIFVDMTPTTYYEILRFPNIHSILGHGDSIQVIAQNEIENILKLVDNDGIIQMTEVYFVKGEIEFIKGPLCGHSNMIRKINKRKCRAYININIGGSILPIGLGLMPLERETRDAE